MLDAIVVGVFARLGVAVLGVRVFMLSVLLCLYVVGRSSLTICSDEPSPLPGWV